MENTETIIWRCHYQPQQCGRYCFHIVSMCTYMCGCVRFSGFIKQWIDFLRPVVSQLTKHSRCVADMKGGLQNGCVLKAQRIWGWCDPSARQSLMSFYFWLESVQSLQLKCLSTEILADFCSSGKSCRRACCCFAMSPSGMINTEKK